MMAAFDSLERVPWSAVTPRYFLPLALKTASSEHSSPLAKLTGAEVGLATLVEMMIELALSAAASAIGLGVWIKVWNVVGTASGTVALADGTGAPPVAMGAAELSTGAGALGRAGAEPPAAPGTHCEYQSLNLVQLAPSAQAESPVKPFPPHWPQGWTAARTAEVCERPTTVK